MPKFNKSRGFKQTGFSYPGVSPLKGKRKTADKLAAKEDLADANAKIDEFGEMKMESTDLMSDKGFSITGGGAGPIKRHSPMKQAGVDQEGGFAELFTGKGNGEKRANISTGSDSGLNQDKELIGPKGPEKVKPKGDGWAKKALKSDIGSAVATSAIESLIGAGINAMTSPKKEKKSRRGPDVSGFSQLKFGRK
tara:strand:+ start:211 stop:792 length:582 start_codon:yes stop_codon:yes gene_type:complete